MSSVVSDTCEWTPTYSRTVLSTLGVTGFSGLVWGFGIRSAIVDGMVASAILINCFWWAIALIRGIGSCCVLPYFLIGSGIFYGVSPLFCIYASDSLGLLSFTADTQREMLPFLNTIHTISLSISLLAAWPFFISRQPFTVNGAAMHGFANYLARLLPILFFGSVLYIFVTLLEFPGTKNIFIALIASFTRSIPYFTIIIAVSVWGRISVFLKISAILLAITLMLFGLISLNKSLFFLPVVCVVVGLLFGSGSGRAVVALLLGCFFLHFGLVAEIVGLGRIHERYDPLLNSISERAAILLDTLQLVQANAVAVSTEGKVARFALTPFESYFVNLYETGFPGESLNAVAWVLIPRILWEDKPAFEPGAEFDLVFRGTLSESNLAIGFIAEGYYNYGWLGVILVSIVVGAQMGWLTKKWLLFLKEGSRHAGVFFLAPALMFGALWVEGNFVGAYVAGFVRLAFMILLLDFVVNKHYQRTQVQIRHQAIFSREAPQ